MKLQVREQIKTLLAQRAKTIKDLAMMLNCKPNSLTQRMVRGSITYNEFLHIAELLNYKIELVDELEK